MEEKKDSFVLSFEEYMALKGWKKVVFRNKEDYLDESLLKKEKFKIVNGERILL